MSTVYVVVALVDYEGSTVMAAFPDEDAARAYIDEYKAHPRGHTDGVYRAEFDHYDIVPVELGARPIDYSHLAGMR